VRAGARALAELGPESPKPAHVQSQAPLASLLATGETASAALLAIAVALGRGSIPATLLEAAQLRLHTWGARLDSEPCDLDRGELLRVLAAARSPSSVASSART
jgi:hypothetical protein